jgi:hypothetical protein
MTVVAKKSVAEILFDSMPQECHCDYGDSFTPAGEYNCKNLLLPPEARREEADLAFDCGCELPGLGSGSTA